MKRLLLFINVIITTTVFSQSTLNETKNVATFIKAWGFLKYYHPTVAKGNFDWDIEFAARIKDVRKLKTKEEFSNYYSAWLNSLGEVHKCMRCRNNIPDSLKFNLDLEWMNDTNIFTNDLIDKFQFIHKNRNQGKNVYLKRNASHGVETIEKLYKDSVFPSPEFRLLSLSRYWNIINYFFPYKYKTDQDWEDVLVEMIPKFKNAKDTIEYHMFIRELVAKINDSHAYLYSKYPYQYFGEKWTPFKFKIIDNKVIVTGIYNDSLCIKDDIRYGDVFLKVNNTPIEEIIRNNSKYISASNNARKLLMFYYAIFNGSTDSVYVTFERNGEIKEKFIRRYYFSVLNYNRNENLDVDTFKIINNNIGYVNMGLLQRKQIKKAIKKLLDTKAIIFDVRNYPNRTWSKIARFLNNKRKPFVKHTIPNLKYPGVVRFVKPYNCGKNNKHYYKGRVVLLFDESTISHAEFTLMALQTAPNVISIGSQTAGADGTVTYLYFPGGIRTRITGIGIYYPDGTETQRIGIVPDIEIKPTIEGIKQGKDEVLEKAIEIINK